LYERLALSRDQDGIRQLAQQGQIVSRPKDLLKEPLVLEFLGLSEQARFSESDLEAAIINQIEHFLLELGKGFCLRLAKNALPLTTTTSLWTWCFTTACCAAMC
jgi:predicted nuclease of restriction endonuclease-like (RecB) superfamily